MLVAGIIGGLIAVPLLAVVNTAVRYLAGHPNGEPVPGGEPPGTQRTADHDAVPVSGPEQRAADSATTNGEQPAAVAAAAGGESRDRS